MIEMLAQSTIYKKYIVQPSLVENHHVECMRKNNERKRKKKEKEKKDGNCST